MKKNNLFFLTLITLMSGTVNAQLGLGTSSPDASALLDLSSTTKGVLFPRMTTLQQAALINPAIGLIVFNTTNNQIETNKGDALGGALWTSTTTTGITAATGTNTKTILEYTLPVSQD